MTAPRAIVVMGVSGCGKSTLGQAIAAALDYAFIEGDLQHPAANVAKMAAGIALDDEDRWPFLENVAAALLAQAPAVAACSALKRSYRDLLRTRVGDVAFVMADLSRAELAARMAKRSGHFMPPALLDSQLATLEPPGADERTVRVPGMAPLDEQVRIALVGLAHLR